MARHEQQDSAKDPLRVRPLAERLDEIIEDWIGRAGAAGFGAIAGRLAQKKGRLNDETVEIARRVRAEVAAVSGVAELVSAPWAQEEVNEIDPEGHSRRASEPRDTATPIGSRTCVEAVLKATARKLADLGQALLGDGCPEMIAEVVNAACEWSLEDEDANRSDQVEPIDTFGLALAAVFQWPDEHVVVDGKHAAHLGMLGKLKEACGKLDNLIGDLGVSRIHFYRYHAGQFRGYISQKKREEIEDKIRFLYAQRVGP